MFLAQGIFNTYSTYEPTGLVTYGDGASAFYPVPSKDYHVYSPSLENSTDLAASSSFSGYNLNSDSPLSNDANSNQQPSATSSSNATTPACYQGYEIPNDFDMVHFD